MRFNHLQFLPFDQAVINQEAYLSLRVELLVCKESFPFRMSGESTYITEITIMCHYCIF